MELNITLIETDDFFAEIYSNPVLNWCTFGLYLIGLLACAGLAMVSWFEKSGQAGPYRTLVNQLASMNIDRFIVFYVLGFVIGASRSVIGPMPSILCNLGQFALVSSGISMLLILLCITATKFAFIYIFKSIPVMEDKFLAIYISLATSMIAILTTTAKLVFEERITVGQRICTGQWSFDDLHKMASPLSAWCGIAAFLINCGLNVAIWVAKKENETVVVPFNHQAAQVTNIGSLATSWIVLTLIFILAVDYVAMQKMDLEELNSDLGQMMAMSFFTIIPFLIVITLFLYYFATKKSLRNALKEFLV